VVGGQRLQPPSSDIFLGWALGDDGRAFYVRQVHDMKTSPNVDAMTPRVLESYATACGWALARAHARAGGKAREVSGYLGQSAAFDLAIARFAETYADQNERDYEALVAARAAGRIVANANGTFATPPQRAGSVKNGAGSKIFTS
ncbi:MAG: DUF2252 family protein, partial [Candidatus Eremiobacteraeota bacterium]|nr:DUF2252 family protein [Candidatus Eremiobacteraeota bacterium]